MGHIALDALPDISMSGHHPYQLGSERPQIIEDQVTYPIVTRIARGTAR